MTVLIRWESSCDGATLDIVGRKKIRSTLFCVEAIEAIMYRDSRKRNLATERSWKRWLSGIIPQRVVSNKVEVCVPEQNYRSGG